MKLQMSGQQQNSHRKGAANNKKISELHTLTPYSLPNANVLTGSRAPHGLCPCTRTLHWAGCQFQVIFAFQECHFIINSIKSIGKKCALAGFRKAST
jgi:hypothetical protein